MNEREKSSSSLKFFFMGIRRVSGGEMDDDLYLKKSSMKIF
jgi:hypothetical protein